jgi:hypothetical protein
LKKLQKEDWLISKIKGYIDASKKYQGLDSSSLAFYIQNLKDVDYTDFF